MAVALYARVSTVRQAEKDLSIPDQLRQMREWCRTNNHLIAKEYVEPGASATDDRRPVFQEMIADATLSPSPFEAVIVHSLSRFFRDSLEFGLYERRLTKGGVRLISITQQTSDDPGGEMARKMFSLFDEYQSKENGKHTLRSMKENARQGFFNGSRPPFGFRSVALEGTTTGRAKPKKRLVIDPSEAAMVRRIFTLYADGDGAGPMGMKAISTHLNQRGQLMRGRPWRIQKVQQVLSDPVYMGEAAFNRHDSRAKRAKPREEWIIFAVDPIIERALFEAVTARRDQNQPAKVSPLVSSPTLLTGLLRCGCCGAGMTMATGKSGRYRYYKCTGKLSKGGHTCTSRNLPMETLDELVLGAVADAVTTPERVRAMLATLKAELKRAQTGDSGHAAALQADIKRIEAAQARLFEAVESGILPLDMALKDHAHTLQAQRQAVLTEFASLRTREALPLDSITPRHIQAFTTAVRARLLNPASGLAKPYLRLLVSEIRVEEDCARITGSTAVLAQMVLENGGVPRSMRCWRPLGDSTKAIAQAVVLPALCRDNIWPKPALTHQRVSQAPSAVKEDFRARHLPPERLLRHPARGHALPSSPARLPSPRLPSHHQPTSPFWRQERVTEVANDARINQHLPPRPPDRQ